jgi:hypothetical protein
MSGNEGVVTKESYVKYGRLVLQRHFLPRRFNEHYNHVCSFEQ